MIQREVESIRKAEFRHWMVVFGFQEGYIRDIGITRSHELHEANGLTFSVDNEIDESLLLQEQHFSASRCLM